MKIVAFHTLKTGRAALIAVALLAGAAMLLAAPGASPASANIYSELPAPIIDAGHGGPDGGAVSKVGLQESIVNLDIALKLEQVFRLYGVCPEMLRRADISLHDPDASTLRQKKNSDLKNRLALVNAVGNGVLISIHQNAFPDARCTGAQTFFASDRRGEALAKAMQQALRLSLDPANDRVPMLTDAYLFKNAQCPSVLIESGFLSNPQEAYLLGTGEYRLKIAATIAASYMQFYKSAPAQEGDLP